MIELFDRNHVLKSIEQAIKIAGYGKTIPNWPGLPTESQYKTIPDLHNDGYLNSHKPNIDSYLLLKDDLKKVSNVFEFRIIDSHLHTAIINTNGLDIQIKKTVSASNLSFSRSFGNIGSSDFKYVEYQNLAHTSRNDLFKKLHELICSIQEKATWFKNIDKRKKIPQQLHGELLLEPSSSVCSVFSPIQRSLIANPSEVIANLFSSVENKIIFSKNLSLIDSGIEKSMVGSSPFDAEGTPRKKNIVIKNGRFLNIKLHNIETAAISNTKSTGNAVRIFSAPPLVAPSNLIIKPGKLSDDDLLSKIDRGVFASGLQPYSNLLTNAWSCNVTMNAMNVVNLFLILMILFSMLLLISSGTRKYLMLFFSKPKFSIILIACLLISLKKQFLKL